MSRATLTFLAVNLVFSKNGPVCPGVSVYKDTRIPGVGKYVGYYFTGYCIVVKMEQNFPNANEHKDFYNAWVVATNQLKLRMPAATWSEYKSPEKFAGHLHQGTVDAMKASRNLLITQPSKEFMDVFIKFPNENDSETQMGMDLTAEYIHEHESDDKNTDLTMKWVPIEGDEIDDNGESFACFYVARKDVKPRDLKDRPINAGPEKSKVARAMEEAKEEARKNEEARRMADAAYSHHNMSAAATEAEINRRAREEARREFDRMVANQNRNQEYNRPDATQIDPDI